MKHLHITCLPASRGICFHAVVQPGTLCSCADYLVWDKPASDKKSRSATPSEGDGEGRSAVPLSELVEVVAGMATPVLHKRGKKDRAHLYISLVRAHLFTLLSLLLMYFRKCQGAVTVALVSRAVLPYWYTGCPQ